VVTDLSNRRCIDIRTTKRADIAGPGEHLLNGGTNCALNYASNGCRRLLSASLVTDSGDYSAEIAARGHAGLLAEMDDESAEPATWSIGLRNGLTMCVPSRLDC